MVHSIDLLRTEDYRAKLDQCIHCGLCLQACPTYAVFGTESEGPRGRIALMKAASAGRIDQDGFSGAFTEHLNSCLACRACETACPSGVQYGALIEPVRVVIERNRTPGVAERVLRWLGLRQLMPHVGRLKLIARLTWLYQRIGAQDVVRKLDFLPGALKAMEAIVPPIDLNYRDYRVPAPAIGERRGRVAFFTGCVQEAFLAPVNEATIRVLQRNGYEVVFPIMQTCCGAAQLHSGEDALARDLARRNIDAFLAEDVDAIVTNAGGCGVSLKEYPHLLHDDPDYQTRVQAFTAKVKDINEFLADHLHAPPKGEVHVRATYVDSCHLRHGQKVVKQPRELLRRIPGLQLVELSQPDRCCGSAGIYNITNADTAGQVLDAKMADIAATGANLVVTTNTGCHMQLIAGVRQARLPVQVMHLIEVLDLSYQSEAAGQKTEDGRRETADERRKLEAVG
jgi:glycolate oxidase iron-sulfur subunit